MKNIIHWCMVKKMWTSHTYLSCTKAESVLILGPWLTETKPGRRSNPKGWVVTDHTNLVLNPTEDHLKYFEKSARLIYSKNLVEFNYKDGICLLFDRDGCFLLEPKRGKLS
jgi:hypothetical protein